MLAHVLGSLLWGGMSIHDTSEMNYQAHAKRVSGLGTVGNGSDVGIFLHPLKPEGLNCGLKVRIRVA
jgi:hypothetical protein